MIWSDGPPAWDLIFIWFHAAAFPAAVVACITPPRKVKSRAIECLVFLPAPWLIEIGEIAARRFRVASS
jgi:hypothetical protein